MVSEAMRLEVIPERQHALNTARISVLGTDKSYRHIADVLLYLTAKLSYK